MRSLVGSRAGRAARGAVIGAALAVAIVLAAAGVAGAAAASPATPPTAHFGTVLPASGSIIVVRRSAGQDALWSVDPVSKAATELVPLSFRPSRVEQSPGGQRLAFLTTAAEPRVVVYDTHTGALHTWSLAARGVKAVDSLAWLTSTKLVVAGRPSHGFRFYPFTDRLYVLNAATGASRRYDNLIGTEPTVAPAKRLVYVRLSDGGRVAMGSPVRWVIERLYSLRLVAGARPRLIGSVKYPNAYDIRHFYEPRLSRDGRYLITSTTGSDISVRYTVRAAATGKALKTVSTTIGHTTAWSNLGDQVAFWGMPGGSATAAVLFVYHAATNTVSKSAKLPHVAVTGLGWSSDDSLLAYSLVNTGGGAFAPDVSELWTLDPASLASQNDLGKGGLPVFMP